MNGDFLGILVDWLRVTGAAEIANAGGLLAALGGIALMLFEVLLLRRQLKLDALIKIMDSNREIVALGFEHPIVWSAMEGLSATILPEEAMVHRRYFQLWINHMQIMWAAWKLGLVSAGEWEAYRLDMAEFLRVRSLQEHLGKSLPVLPKGIPSLGGPTVEDWNPVGLASCADKDSPPVSAGFGAWNGMKPSHRPAVGGRWLWCSGMECSALNRTESGPFLLAVCG